MDELFATPPVRWRSASVLSALAACTDDTVRLSVAACAAVYQRHDVLAAVLGATPLVRPIAPTRLSPLASAFARVRSTCCAAVVAAKSMVYANEWHQTAPGPGLPAGRVSELQTRVRSRCLYGAVGPRRASLHNAAACRLLGRLRLLRRLCVDVRGGQRRRDELARCVDACHDVGAANLFVLPGVTVVAWRSPPVQETRHCTSLQEKVTST